MPESIDNKRVVLSTAEASELTGLSSRYIQRLLTEERIEGVKVGSFWLAYQDSLMAFLAQPRKRGPKGPHKKSRKNQAKSSIEVRNTEVKHINIEGETNHAEGKEVKTGK